MKLSCAWLRAWFPVWGGFLAGGLISILLVGPVIGPAGEVVDSSVRGAPQGRAQVPAPAPRAAETEYCDGILRNQFVFQRNASTAAGFNDVVDTIHQQREACSSVFWSPVVTSPTAFGAGPHCWPFDSFRNRWVPASGYSVGSVLHSAAVPADLLDPATGAPRLDSGRDSDNDLIVYFSDPSSVPDDGASCWLYVAYQSQWYPTP